MNLYSIPFLLISGPFIARFTHAQGSADCAGACDTYNTNLANTAAIYSTDVENPFTPISPTIVQHMCGDFSEFSNSGSALVCYGCGGFGGTDAQEELLNDWALVCATYIENGAGADGQNAGATCWNSGLQSDCGTL